MTLLTKLRNANYGTAAAVQKIKQHFELYVPNIKHTRLRGPEKDGGDKINGFNWEWNPVIK